LALARVQAVVVEQSNMTSSAASKPLAEAAASKRLPTVYSYRQNVDAGGLVSYGVNLDWCNHRAAYYVDKILKGAKPADLPVEQPTKFKLVLNLKTAHVLGIGFPQSLILSADEMIGA
jgi:putative ABC transport system substrate-binding protein